MQFADSPTSGQLVQAVTRAAQYVRMSTEHQRYSVLNQIDAIHQYAAQRGISVVRTYSDEGRSGLSLKSRPALQSLLKDVVSGDADYSLILVYDVSRWGRFQDVDEAAHYEFLCRQAGINIQYCAEPFENDGNPMGTLLKSIKRVMAAEFSRELSVKVFMGQRRIARMGYLPGGRAGFGMQRLVVDENGNRKAILKPGEHKYVATHRTILMPGLPSEVAVVRYMYRACKAGKTYHQIAAALNENGKLTGRGNVWCAGSIGAILRNEKYVGSLIWNKTSIKLGTAKRANPRPEWVRVEDAFKPVISRELFDEARQAVRERLAPPSQSELLKGLRRLLREKGRLSQELIHADKRIPGPNTYKLQFGSLHNAYKRVGFKPRGKFNLDRYRKLNCLTRQLVAETASNLSQSGRVVRIIRGQRSIIVGEAVTIHFNSLGSNRKSSGACYWDLIPKIKPEVAVLVVTRMDHDNDHVQDFLLLPREVLSATWIRIYDGRNHPLETFRATDLDPLYTVLNPQYLSTLPMQERIREAIREASERSRTAGIVLC